MPAVLRCESECRSRARQNLFGQLTVASIFTDRDEPRVRSLEMRVKKGKCIHCPVDTRQFRRFSRGPACMDYITTAQTNRSNRRIV
jgi:hypothetical protein